jgi:6-pyruvoyltetrahydropterin/6-carboxytetrahydropterin synthase
MNTLIKARRQHGFAYGHTVFGHEDEAGNPGKCSHLHGHQGEVTFFCEAESLDMVGRVIDFGIIKTKLCAWLEETWDHKFLVYNRDPRCLPLKNIDPEGVLIVSFNPTSKNLASYLMGKASELLLGSGVYLTKIIFMETPKCGCEISWPPPEEIVPKKKMQLEDWLRSGRRLTDRTNELPVD